MKVDQSTELARTISSLAVFHGLNTDQEIAQMIRKAGFEVSQQSVNNYRHARREKGAPAGFVVAFIRGLPLSDEDALRLLRVFLRDNRDVEDLMWIWFMLQKGEQR
jgi:hypothetical protein